jgi:LDH2 family malate/lactate/ureidoglycolate dehydrogenase
MNIAINELRMLLAQAWSATASRPEAEYIADAVIYATLTKDSRMRPVHEAVSDLKSALAQRPHSTVVQDFGPCLLLDFGGTSPLAHMQQIHDQLRRRSAQFGIATCALRNTAGIHQLSTWIEPLSRSQDMIALFMWNGGSYTVAPFGSRDPFFGTNPIAYAIPTDTEPIICDMATSEIPFMSLMAAMRGEMSLPGLAGLDSHGRKTSAPREIYDMASDGPVRLLPMGGGYKGSALMLLIEVMTGALIGAKMGREATDSSFVPQEFGGWLVVVRVDSFGDAAEFRRRVGALAKSIRESTPAANNGAVVLPGDRAHAEYQRAVATGTVDVDAEDLAYLRALALRVPS